MHLVNSLGSTNAKVENTVQLNLENKGLVSLRGGLKKNGLMYADLSVKVMQSVVEKKVKGVNIHIADLCEGYLRIHPEQLGKSVKRNLNKCVLKREKLRTKKYS